MVFETGGGVTTTVLGVKFLASACESFAGMMEIAGLSFAKPFLPTTTPSITHCPSLPHDGSHLP